LRYDIPKQTKWDTQTIAIQRSVRVYTYNFIDNLHFCFVKYI